MRLVKHMGDPLISSQNSDEFHPRVVDWEENTILDLHDVCVLFNVKAFVSKTFREHESLV